VFPDEPTICYKIVSFDFNTHTTTSIYVRGPYMVTYKLGEWVKADPDALKAGFALTAFSSLLYAKNFYSGLGEIYIAYGYKPVMLPPVRLGALDVLERNFVWNDMKHFMSIPSIITSGWPAGTVMFEEIELLKRVY